MNSNLVLKLIDKHRVIRQEISETAQMIYAGGIPRIKGAQQLKSLERRETSISQAITEALR